MGFRSDQTGGSSGGGGGFDTLPGMMGSSAQYPTHSSAAASSSSTAEPSHQECTAGMNNAANAINNNRSADGGSAEVINPETGETAPEECLRMMEEHIVNSMNVHGPVGVGGSAAAGKQQQQQMGNVQTPLAGAGFPYDLGGHNGLAGGGGVAQGASNNGEPDPFAALFSAPFF
ncbi:unnamed protein product [Tilletia controversa]|nr:unnamed protein product [Tilletia controversa]